MVRWRCAADRAGERGARLDESGRRRSTGFTLVELLVVLSIIVLLAGIVSGAALTFRRIMQNKAAAWDIKTFSIALAAYKLDFGRYPPDDFIPDTASTAWDPKFGMNEVLYYYLGLRHQKGLNMCGPYGKFREKRLVDEDGDGFKEYLDPYGGLYYYAENASDPIRPGKHKDSYDIVSPGLDGMLGAEDVMTTEGGYEPTEDPFEEDNVSN
jgi:prepilin-type N-terminal cleavage/methylation domain-containing protein